MIRRYQPGDHVAIGRIFHEAVHQLASHDYTQEQCRAWSDGNIDFRLWQQRCGRKRPFVKEHEGQVVGFMELDPDGHIDCTYVDPAHARRGYMSQVMEGVKNEAHAKGIEKLFAEVSITARPFFERHGFRHIRNNEVHVRGETLVNFIMECYL